MARQVHFIELAPLVKKKVSHHFLHVGEVIQYADEAGAIEWLNGEHNPHVGIALTVELLEAKNSDSIMKSLNHLSNRKSVFFEIPHLPTAKRRARELLANNLHVDLLFHKRLSQVEETMVVELVNLDPELRLYYLESRVSADSEVLATLPPILQNRVSFISLPQRDPRDCLLNKKESIERMALRESEASHLGLDLNILSLYSEKNPLDVPQMRGFLPTPQKKPPMDSQHSSVFLRIALKVVHHSGLIFFLGLFFWLLKIVLNPQGYKVREELGGWIRRFCGACQGFLTDLFYFQLRAFSWVPAFTINTYWRLRRCYGRLWQIRVLCINTFWSFRRRWDNSWQSRALFISKIKWLCGYPFFKCYWFLQYQWKKRIVRTHPENGGGDD